MTKCYYCDAVGRHTLDCPTLSVDETKAIEIAKRTHEVAAPKDAPYQPLKRFVIEDVMPTTQENPNAIQTIALPWGGSVIFHDHGYDVYRTLYDGTTEVTHVPAKTPKESE